MTNYPFFLLTLSFVFISSCFQQIPAPVINAPAPLVTRNTVKQTDVKKQRRCAQARKPSACEGDSDCEDICDDLFPRRGHRQDCYKLPSSLVYDFEEMIERAENGDVSRDDFEVLECLLDIDESEFAKAAGKMSRREAKEFLALITEDEDLAEVLEDEDDEFNILKQAIHKAVGSNDLQDALRSNIESGKSFLWLAGEGNEYAWDYLDNYVEEKCDRGSSDECPGGENIGAYCYALLSMSRGDLEDFLSSADLFGDEYEREVENEDYEYEVTNNPGRNYDGDFRDYCNFVILPSSYSSGSTGTGNTGTGNTGTGNTGTGNTGTGNTGTGNTGTGNNNNECPLYSASGDSTFTFEKSGDYLYRGSDYENEAGESPGALGDANSLQDLIKSISHITYLGLERFIIVVDRDELPSASEYYLYINRVGLRLQSLSSYSTSDGDRYTKMRSSGFPADAPLLKNYIRSGSEPSVGFAYFNNDECVFL